MKTLSLLPALPALNKQFRYLPNYADNLHTFIMPGWLLPGFAFMRSKSAAVVLSIYVKDLAGNTVAELDPGQMRAYTTTSADYFKLSSRPTANNALDGDSFLDNGTYLKHKAYTLPCGIYYYQIHFSDGSDVYSDVWKVESVSALLSGTELVANGDFSTGMLQWSTTGAWTADPANNNASYSGAGSGMVLQQALPSGNDTGDKRYKVTFTVASMAGTGAGKGLAIQVYDDAGSADYDQELRITTNGTYSFYASKLNTLTITSTGITGFRIGPISIQEIIGAGGEFITIQTYNNCRALNSLNQSDADYLEWFMLPARILEPEYKDVLQQSENGHALQVTTFARSVKTLNLTPLQLPEFVITYLNTFNVYDSVAVYDGITHERYAYDVDFNDEDANVHEITEFKLSNEWQGSSIYGLATLKFNCTIDLSDSCCGNIEAVTCMDTGDYALNISVADPGQPIVTILEGGWPIIGSGNLWAELFVAIIANGEFTTCNIPLTYYNSAGVIPAQQYATIGFQYQMPEDAVGNTFCFFIKLYQLGCPDYAVSNKVSYIPE